MTQFKMLHKSVTHRGFTICSLYVLSHLIFMGNLVFTHIHSKKKQNVLREFNDMSHLTRVTSDRAEIQTQVV